MKPKTFDAIIVGAGLAGLSCARRLQTKGVDYFLIEASDRPGGRVKSDVVEGFILNHGFQVLQTAYPEAQRLLDYSALNLRASPRRTARRSGRLLAHRNSCIRNQSLAEARIPVGGSTVEHYHIRTEEIYYITHGTGRLRIEGELQEVGPGDAIAIPPGRRHKLWNTGAEPLRLLCACAPAYEHEDTVLTERA